MGSSYYRVLADPTKNDRWFLDDPLAENGQVIDAREFTRGTFYEGPRPAVVPIAQSGKVANFNFGAFDMPVTSERIAGTIQSFALNGIQVFPVTINSQDDRFAIINVLAKLRCLDEKLSEIMRWEPEDGRPDEVGQYRMITNLRIDPQRCRGSHVFRVEGWEIALIVSGDVKNAIECDCELGAAFAPVST
jgi:uncharacterized protein DUF1629